MIHRATSRFWDCYWSLPTLFPKGVEHKPSSENGYKALLIEPEGVSNTGDVRSEVTITKVEWV